MISYKKFWETLKIKEVSTYALVEKYGLSSSVLQRMRNEEYLSLRKIDDLCRILDCEISDIVEYVPNKKDEVDKTL